MTLTGTRFGTIEYQSNDVFRFDEGLIGFPMLQEFVFLEHKPDSPFRWLQSVEEPALAFLVTDPHRFVPDYTLRVQQESEVVLATVAIPAGRPMDMTLNLAGPLVLDATNQRGRQVVLDDGSYTVKHRVFAEAQTPERAAA